MSELWKTLPLADPGREQDALDRFPMHESPGLYAARNAHLWLCFSFDDVRYRNDALTAWVQELGDIFFQRHGAPSLEQLRLKYLSPEERLAIEEAQKNERNADGLQS